MDPEAAAPSGENAAPNTFALTSQLLKGEPDLHAIIVEFVESLPSQAAAVRAAQCRLDWESLRTLVYRLKGAGGSYGYPELSAVASAMEGCFESHSIDEFERLTRRLDTLIEAATAGLEARR